MINENLFIFILGSVILSGFMFCAYSINLANQKVEYLATELAKLKPLETTLEVEKEKWKNQALKHATKGD